MPTLRAAVYWMIFLGCALSLAPASVREGMNREEVIAVLGHPTSVLSRGELTILNYPGNGRVELISGRVVSSLRVTVEPPTKPAVASPPALAPATPTPYDAEAISLEDPFDSPAEDTPPYGLWLELAIEFSVRTLVGWIVLKLAFKWEGLRADWGELILPTLAAAGAGTLTRATAWQVWHTTDIYHLDEALSYAVLVLTLLRLTNACTWSRAAGVAVAAKLMTLVAWSLLIFVLTRLRFT